MSINFSKEQQLIFFKYDYIYFSNFSDNGVTLIIGHVMIKNIFLAIVISCNLFGIQEESADTVKFIFEPDSIYLNVGETGILKVKMINKD